MDNWCRVTDPKSLRDAAGGPRIDLAARAYRGEARPWPRLVLRVCRGSAYDRYTPTLSVECGRRNSPLDEWHPCGIPASLVPELIEMLNEANRTD